jgi:hypothetical protein
MSLSTGGIIAAGQEWGRARKREDIGKQPRIRGGEGDVTSISSVLLSKDSTGCGDMMVNGCEHRAEEKICQYNILGVNHEMKKCSYSAI